jgi:hypothetical protein
LYKTEDTKMNCKSLTKKGKHFFLGFFPLSFSETELML